MRKVAAESQQCPRCGAFFNGSNQKPITPKHSSEGCTRHKRDKTQSPIFKTHSSRKSDYVLP
jgi:hypothetical protein